MSIVGGSNTFEPIVGNVCFPLLGFKRSALFETECIEGVPHGEVSFVSVCAQVVSMSCCKFKDLMCDTFSAYSNNMLNVIVVGI